MYEGGDDAIKGFGTETVCPSAYVCPLYVHEPAVFEAFVLLAAPSTRTLAVTVLPNSVVYVTEYVPGDEYVCEAVNELVTPQSEVRGELDVVPSPQLIVYAMQV
jgi:hypothetical protein